MKQGMLIEVIDVFRKLVHGDVIVWSGKRLLGSTKDTPGTFADWPLLREASTLKTPSGILSPREHHLCNGCPSQSQCGLQAELVFPFEPGANFAGFRDTIYVHVALTQRDDSSPTGITTLYPVIEHFARYTNLLVSRENSLSEIATMRQQLQYLLDLLPEGAMLLDRDKEVVSTNTAADDFALRDNLKADGNLSGLYKSLGHKTESLTSYLTPSGDLMVRGRSFYCDKQFTGAILHTLNFKHLRKDAQVSSLKPKTSAHIIGKDPSLLKVVSIIRQSARSDSTILLRGESGTGKEVFARTIHEMSPRAQGPFIAINCAAIPEQLLESELFGYEEGSFTGARKGGKQGQIESANLGTLFLDEIGDMPISLQAKLLRVIQSKQIQRIGGSRSVLVNVRFVAATHRNLEDMISQGTFREDLFFRLSVIPAHIPPLRERKSDIELLLNFYLNKHCIRLQKSFKVFSYEARQILINYAWPGNIRELENVVEYLVNVHDQDIITPEHLPLGITHPRVHRPDSGPSLHNGSRQSLAKCGTNEQMELIKLLDTYGWDVAGKQQTAQVLKISLATLYRLLAKYKIKSGDHHETLSRLHNH